MNPFYLEPFKQIRPPQRIWWQQHLNALVEYCQSSWLLFCSLSVSDPLSIQTLDSHIHLQSLPLRIHFRHTPLTRSSAVFHDCDLVFALRFPILCMVRNVSAFSPGFVSPGGTRKCFQDKGTKETLLCRYGDLLSQVQQCKPLVNTH